MPAAPGPAGHIRYFGSTGAIFPGLTWLFGKSIPARFRRWPGPGRAREPRWAGSEAGRSEALARNAGRRHVRALGRRHPAASGRRAMRLAAALSPPGLRATVPAGRPPRPRLTCGRRRRLGCPWPPASAPPDLRPTVPAGLPASAPPGLRATVPAGRPLAPAGLQAVVPADCPRPLLARGSVPVAERAGTIFRAALGAVRVSITGLSRPDNGRDLRRKNSVINPRPHPPRRTRHRGPVNLSDLLHVTGLSGLR
jgi:hypothetical protein